MPSRDVLIIGGGPAGLSVATGLARQLYTATIFDSNVYRNRTTSHMHNVLTWDHAAPADFRRKGRADLAARYNTIEIQDETEIVSVARNEEGGFEAKDAGGEVWVGRRLVLAMGVRDVFPGIEGYAECWGVGIAHCLFCHGYEDRGCASAGVLAVDDLNTPEAAIHKARMAHRLSENVTIYTHGAEDLASQIQTTLKNTTSTITTDPRPISSLTPGPTTPQIILTFSNGDTKTEGFLVHKPPTTLHSPFAHQLSLELTQKGDIKTWPPFYETSVKGVFAVGDCAAEIKAVPVAVAMGTLAAAGVVGGLL